MEIRWAVFFVLVILFSCAAASDSVLGCGGYVRAQGDLDLRQVVVKLLTKQGTLKYETDVAPNNGYFFLPVYDKADYVIKVEPPNGWTFKPSEIPVTIDGVSDPCTTNQDLNFVFEGFSVLGRVTTIGTSSGPPGISVVLTDKTGSQVSRVTTISNGDFIFPNVNGGTYSIHIEHALWKTSPNGKSKDESVVVSVANGNGVVPSGKLFVHGFDVSGQVTSEKEPMKGVSFLLFSDSDVKVSDCDASLPVGVEPAKGFKCRAVSTESGKFVFPTVPAGRYTVVPHFVLETGGFSSKFDVQPRSFDIVVVDDSVKIAEDFIVAGFGVTGYVLSSLKGSGLANAEVFVDGLKVGVSDERGSFKVDSVKSGDYVMTAKADGFVFPDVKVKMSPKAPVLPDLVPQAVRLCGKIGISALPSGVKSDEFKIVVEKGECPILPVNADGTWCGFLPQGSYVIRVDSPATAKNSGVSFAPYDRKVVLSEKPLSGLDFVQFKAVVAGKVSCDLGNGETCFGVRIKLSPVIETPAEGYVQKSVDLKPSLEDNFEFTDVLPGPYKILVTSEGYCWDKSTTEIEVSSSDIRNVVIKRLGVSVTFESSHATQIDAVSNGSLVESFEVKAGVSERCFKTSGLYEFVPKGCHAFGDKNVVVDTGVPGGAKVSLRATKHVLSGVVRADVGVKDLVVAIKDSDQLLGELGLTPVSSGKEFEYKFDFWASPGDHLTITPMAAELLFDPVESQLTMPNDCLPNGPKFSAKRGVFYVGSVKPPLQDVSVRISREDGEAELMVLTDEKGEYRVGPLKDSKYRAVAGKGGYSIQPDGPPTALGEFVVKLDFIGEKLAEIAVVAKSDAGDALSGVLVTVSGGVDFRENRLTGSDGKISFLGLSPGEYFVKPVLKEYRQAFEPASVVASVAQGQTLHVDASAHRVAFSAFGSVISLAGEPEPGISVVAEGLTTCSQYAEEAVTESDGTFRIRGLLPTCTYVLKVVKDKGFEWSPAEGLRVTPADRDVTNLRLILFRKTPRMTVSVNVDTDEEFLSSLRAVICAEDQPNVEVTTKSFKKATGLAVLPGSLDRNAGTKKYILRLESTLSHAQYEYRTAEITFTADKAFKHFNLEFRPRRKAVEHEFKETSAIALPVLVLVVLGVLNAGKVWPAVAGVLGTVGGGVVSSLGSIGSSVAAPTVREEPDISWADTPSASTAKKKQKAKRA